VGAPVIGAGERAGRRALLDDLRVGRVGDANRARYRIAAAITRGPVPLREAERDRPAHLDPTRPTTAVAAFPGGVVPDDVPSAESHGWSSPDRSSLGRSSPGWTSGDRDPAVLDPWTGG
jgi:hypothetical protein